MFKQVALQQMPEKLQQLCEILKHASQIIVYEYESYRQGEQFLIEKKQDQSPVTQADLKANAYITAQLQQLQDGYPILSEEGEQQGRENWTKFWMLDPLDGTKEFINQTGEFTINLSLINHEESVISAIAVPLQQTIYINQKGSLPFRWQWSEQDIVLSQYQTSPDHNTTVLRIAISRRPERSHVYTDFLNYLDQQDIVYQKVAAGSAYKFCMMLEDQIDIYPRFHPTSEWDTAAGQGLLQGIGGDIFDLKHRAFIYNQRSTILNQSFIAVRHVQDWQHIEEIGRAHV